MKTNLDKITKRFEKAMKKDPGIRQYFAKFLAQAEESEEQLYVAYHTVVYQDILMCFNKNSARYDEFIEFKEILKKRVSGQEAPSNNYFVGMSEFFQGFFSMTNEQAVISTNLLVATVDDFENTWKHKLGIN